MKNAISYFSLLTIFLTGITFTLVALTEGCGKKDAEEKALEILRKSDEERRKTFDPNNIPNTIIQEIARSNRLVVERMLEKITNDVKTNEQVHSIAIGRVLNEFMPMRLAMGRFAMLSNCTNSACIGNGTFCTNDNEIHVRYTDGREERFLLSGQVDLRDIWNQK